MLWCDSVAPFGKPVVPEVYWMLMGSSRSSLIRPSAATSPVVAISASHDGLPQHHHEFQRGAPRPDRGDHRRVVGGLQPLRGDQHSRTGLLEHKLQFPHPVRRVDVDQDRADLRGGVLGDRPFRAVRRPDTDPVALPDPHREQAERDRVHVRGQLGVGPAPPGGPVHQRLPRAVPADRGTEVRADRVTKQGCRGRARRIAEHADMVAFISAAVLRQIAACARSTNAVMKSFIRTALVLRPLNLDHPGGHASLVTDRAGVYF